MSTRSTISILKEDGSVEQIYAHWDGYISNNGVILFNYYQDNQKVKELINLGNLSSLQPEIYPTEDHSYDKPQSKVTIFYERDRGEDNAKAEKFDNLKSFLKEAELESYDYIYKEKNKKWYLLDAKENKLKSLKTLIKKEWKDIRPEYKKDFIQVVQQQKDDKVLNIDNLNNKTKVKIWAYKKKQFMVKEKLL